MLAFTLRSHVVDNLLFCPYTAAGIISTRAPWARSAGSPPAARPKDEAPLATSKVSMGESRHMAAQPTVPQG